MDLENLISEKEAAKYLGRSQAALRVARANGTGPSYYRIGNRSIRYRVTDLEVFLKQCHVVQAVPDVPDDKPRLRSV